MAGVQTGTDVLQIYAVPSVPRTSEPNQHKYWISAKLFFYHFQLKDSISRWCRIKDLFYKDQSEQERMCLTGEVKLQGSGVVNI